jgi:hypothetical protein
MIGRSQLLKRAFSQLGNTCVDIGPVDIALSAGLIVSAEEDKFTVGRERGAGFVVRRINFVSQAERLSPAPVFFSEDDVDIAFPETG